MENTTLQSKINGWHGKALASYYPTLYRQARVPAVIFVDGVRRSRKPKGRDPPRVDTGVLCVCWC